MQEYFHNKKLHFQDKFKQTQQKTIALYRKYERFVPVVCFAYGFTSDTFFLSVENLSDHLFLLAYTILAGGIILIIGLIRTGQISHPKILRFQKYYPYALQFFLGNLFSAYIVYYFKSAAVSQSIVFLGLLFIMLIANEFLGDRLTNITLLCTLYFFVTFAFLTFFIPVLSRSISSAMFYSSGIISFLATSAIIGFIYRKIFKEHPKKIAGPAISSAVVFGLMIFFYLSNWIPPVPISLKESGIYHSLEVDRNDGHLYKVAFYRRYPFLFWIDDDSNYKYVSGDTVFCYASVFAPPGWQERIDFHWQKYDPSKEQYITTDVIGYNIHYVPGRDKGYRGYTFKRNVQPGDWRIDVEIETGSLRQVLGRIDFEIITHEGEKGREVVQWR